MDAGPLFRSQIWGKRVSGRGSRLETHSPQLCSLDLETEWVVCACADGDQRTWRSALNVMVHFESHFACTQVWMDAGLLFRSQTWWERVSSRGTRPETHSPQLCSLDFGTERAICTCASGDQRTWRSALHVMVHF